MDTVFIEGLRVEAMIGAHNWEQRITRTLILDLELACNATHAAKTDQLTETIDYKAVCERVRTFSAASRHRLIESLAEELAEVLLREFRLRWLRLAVRKPGAIAGTDSVGVRIERGSR